MDWTSPTVAKLRSDDPKPEKPPKVELTKADKKRVIDEFKEVMEREPTEEEVEELYAEEKKLKRGKSNGKEGNNNKLER